MSFFSNKITFSLDMKWWKYSWAAIGDIIFIVILSAIFNGIADSGTRKLMAVSVVIYLCVIGIGAGLSRQIGSGFGATMLVLQSMVRKNARLEDTNEDKDFKNELDTAVAKLEKDTKERNTKMIIHGCFSIIICIWM